MVAHTAKGTATDKSTGLTLSLASVLIAQNARIVVGLAYDVGAGAPVVTWGADELTDDNTVSGNGITAKTVSFYHTGAADTRTVTATWTTTAPTAKAMYVSELTEVNEVERRRGNSQAATTNPTSGIRTGDFYDEVYVGTMGSEGPPSDTSGTVQGGYTSGQRAGTAGAPPASNVTVHEIYQIPDEPGATEAEKTGTTSRDWSTNLVIYRVGGTQEARDSRAMREAWEALLETVAVVQGYGATVSLKDDASLDITDFTVLRLTKT